MTPRALILGLTLGFSIAAATYYNDAVIRQTMLIGNHFPVGVFGVLLLLLAANPLIARLGLGGGQGLRPAEYAVIAALGLAACGWPGSNFYRAATTIPAMPQHWLRREASWKAANVMAYVPGASATVAEGHVQDWSGVVAGLTRGQRPDADALDRAIWQRLTPAQQRLATQAEPQHLDAADRANLIQAVNDLIRCAPGEDQVPLYNWRPSGAAPLSDFTTSSADADARSAAASGSARGDALSDELAGLRLNMQQERRLATIERANRMTLVEHWDGALLSPPAGDGVLITGGRADPFAVDTLLTGRSQDRRLSLVQLPWSAWWPAIRLWGGVSLLLGVAALCMALIVHPQWSQRELLAYPIARFVEEASARAPNSSLPALASNRVFWLGASLPIGLHLINGLHAWFPEMPDIPMQLDFSGLRVLFPAASRAPYSDAYFTPTLYFTVIAFSFFLATKVSLSLGVSQLLFVMLGATLIAHGGTMDIGYMAAKKSNLLRFGGYVGMLLMILYAGRRFYWNATLGAVGLHRGADLPRYLPWAVRVLALSVFLAIGWLTTAGLSWPVATACVFLSLLIFLVMARICAETGLFFNQAAWLPVGVLTALIGGEALGPTHYIVLAIASIMIVGDPREALMPYLSNALKLGDRPDEARTRPGRLAFPLGGMLIASFFIAGAVTLHAQYNLGANAKDGWAREALPSMPFHELSLLIRELSAQGTLATSAAATGWERLALIKPNDGALGWITLGLVLVVGTAVARLRLPWWPLHPVAFLVWGTYPMGRFAFSFLIGWLIKAAVIKAGGVRGFQQIKPAMVGIIAGEMAMIMLWMIIGAAYYLITGLEPQRYAILPG